MDSKLLLNEIDSYRHHFDNIFVGGIPKLFNETGVFLSFVSMLSAIEALAGLMAPNKPTGERFMSFIETYFPDTYHLQSAGLWKFRNTMIHSFSPGTYLLTCHTSRMHLKAVSEESTLLNAEDFFASLLQASSNYFEALALDANLQTNFIKRVADSNGGAPRTISIARN
jgi:hypothetical protein